MLVNVGTGVSKPTTLVHVCAVKYLLSCGTGFLQVIPNKLFCVQVIEVDPTLLDIHVLEIPNNQALNASSVLLVPGMLLSIAVFKSALLIVVFTSVINGLTG